MENPENLPAQSDIVEVPPRGSIADPQLRRIASRYDWKFWYPLTG